MPFVDEPSIQLPVGRFIGEEEEEATAGEVFKAAVATDNSFGSWLFKESGQPDFFVTEPEFNPLNHLSEQELLDDSFMDEAAYADSVSEIDAIRKQQQFEIKQRQILNDAGGWGVLASMGAGVMDPINFIPVGGTAYKTYRSGSSILKNALVTGSVAAGSAAASEAAIHLTQIERTLGESAATATGAFFLGGAIGIGARKLARLNDKKIETLNKEIEDSMEPEIKIQEGMNPALTREDNLALSSVGAFEVHTGQTVIRGKAARGAIKGLNKTVIGGSPLMRNALSEKPQTRQITSDLAEQPLDIEQQIPKTEQTSKQGSAKEQPEGDVPLAFDPEKNIVRQAAQTTIKVKSDHQLEAYTQVFNEQYKKYLQGTRRIAAADVFKKKFTDKMSATKFAEAVSSANRNNDVHVVPEVQVVAQAARKFVYDPNLKAAQETFDETTGKPMLPVDINVKTAPTYLNRIWDTIKLVRGTDRFVGKTSKWLAEEDQRLFSKAEEAKDKILGVEAEIDEVGLKIQLRKLEDRLDTKEEQLVDLLDRPDASVAGKKKKAKKKEPEKVGNTQLEIEQIKAEIKQVNKVIGKEKKRITNVADDILSDEELNLLGIERAEVERIKKIREAAVKGLDLEDLDAEGLKLKLKEFNKLKKDLKSLVNKAEFKKSLEFAPQDYDKLALEIHTRLTTLHDGELPYDYKIGGNSQKGLSPNVRGPLARRSFEVPDELIEEFLVNDNRILMQRYSRSMVTQIEFINRYGDLDMSKQIDQIKESWADDIRQASKTDPDKAQKLRNIRDREVKDLGIMRDRIQMRHQAPQHELAERMMRSARDLNFARLLGGVVAASVPDTARIVASEGIVDVFRHGLIPLVTNLKAFRMSALDARAWGVGIDGILGGRAEILADISSYTLGGNVFERALRANAKAFANISLMNQWTAFVKQLHIVTAQTRMIKAIKANKWDPRFGQLDISPEDFPNLRAQLEEYGEVIGGVEVANSKLWDNPALQLKWGGGLRKMSDRTILVPGQEIPQFMTTEAGKTIFQFRSFMVSATSRILISNLQKQDAHYIQGMVGMVAIGMMSYAFKEWDAGRDITDDPKTLVLEGIDRSGMLGIIMESNNMLEKISRHRLGLRPTLGITTPSGRFASRTRTETVLGPTFGSLLDLGLNVPGSILDDDAWKASDTRAVRRLLPYQNLSIMRQGFDSIEAGINESLGITPIPRKTEGLFE